MECYKELYVSEELKKKQKKILRKLRQNQLMLNVYVITLTKNEANHLEFYNAALLHQKIFAKEPIFIVGIARGYDNALLLVEEITQEVYDKTGGADIRTYIKNRQKELKINEM